MQDLRIALAQITCPVGELAANVEKHRRFARRAADGGARIICFPECSLTGYPQYTDERMHGFAQPLDGELAQQMVKLCAETGLFVLAGMIERGADGVLYNTQLVTGPEGVVGAYRKTHISDLEGAFFGAGDRLEVFSHECANFGVLICYDNHFPEAARTLGLRGAEIIFCPYGSPGPCSPEGYEAKQTRWLRYLTARALDNSLYMAVVNHVGQSGYSQEGPLTDSPRPEDTHVGVCEYPGGSMALNPWGQKIARASVGAEDLLIVDLEAETMREKREDELQYFERFRRPDLYGDLTRAVKV